MALPSTGAIALSLVNAEVGASSSATRSLGDSVCRQLAQASSGTISMANLRGKAWLTQSMVADHVYANRSAFFNWCLGGSGDYRNVNNPYSRYTSSSSWTASFSLSGQTLPSSTWTTVVITITATGPSFNSYNINGGAIGIDQAIEVYSDYEERQRVLYVHTDYKNITSVYVLWNHTSANRGSFASVAIIPGKWTGYSRTVNHLANAGASSPPDSITLGSYYGNPNGALGFVHSPSSGTAMMRFDAWWYSNGGLYMVVNPNSGYGSYGVYAGATDNYGNFVTYGYVNAVSYTGMGEA
jgi:hypothetical protein